MRRMTQTAPSALTVTFAGSGDAFGSGGRYQACIHLRPARPAARCCWTAAPPRSAR